MASAQSEDVYFVVGRPVTEFQTTKQYRIVCDERRAIHLASLEPGVEYRRCTNLTCAEQLQRDGFPPAPVNSAAAAVKRSQPSDIDHALKVNPSLSCNKVRKRVDPFSRLDSLPDFVAELTRQLDFSSSCTSHDIQQVQQVRANRLVVLANSHGWCFVDLACSQFQFGRNMFCPLESSPEVVKRQRTLIVSSIQQAMVHMNDYLRARDHSTEKRRMTTTPTIINLWLPQAQTFGVTLPESSCANWFASCLSRRSSTEPVVDEIKHPGLPEQIAMPFLLRFLTMHPTSALRFSFSFRCVRDVPILRLGQNFLKWKLRTLEADDAVFSNPLAAPQVKRLAWHVRDVPVIPTRAQLMKPSHSTRTDALAVAEIQIKHEVGTQEALPFSEVRMANGESDTPLHTCRVPAVPFLTAKDQVAFAECRAVVSALRWCKWLIPRQLQRVRIQLAPSSLLMTRLEQTCQELGTLHSIDAGNLTAPEYLELRELLQEFGSRIECSTSALSDTNAVV